MNIDDGLNDNYPKEDSYINHKAIITAGRYEGKRCRVEHLSNGWACPDACKKKEAYTVSIGFCRQRYVRVCKEHLRLVR